MWTSQERTIILMNNITIVCVLGLLSVFCCILLMALLTKLTVFVILHIQKIIKKYKHHQEVQREQSNQVVSLKDLKRVKSNLKLRYPNDYFFCFREPGIVKSTGSILIDNLGSISTWMLQCSQLDQNESEIDTEDEDFTEKINTQKLIKCAIQDANATIKIKNQQERAALLFQRMKKRYERYGVTVMVTSHKWIGTWNSLADCYLKKKQYGHNLLIIIS